MRLPFPQSPIPAAMRGLSLVELMISLLLGLVVVGSAITVFISNRQTYAATENLGRIQENGRIAFELMARDLREAGGTACDRDLPTVNVLNNADATWWSTWGAAVTGFDGTGAFPDEAFGTGVAQRVDGTDGVIVRSAVSNGLTVADHQPTSANFTVNTVNHDLNDGDIIMVCDFNHAAIAQVTNAQPGINDTIVHNTGTGTPGNATGCLSIDGPSGCGGGPVRTYSFGCFQGRRLASGACAPMADGSAPPNWPAQIAKLRAWRWFIGNNARGGRSLYRTGLGNTGGALSFTPTEIAENVSDMQLAYLLDGAYVDASTISATEWVGVLAVRITLTLISEDNVGSDGAPIERQISHTVALRNRTG